MRNYLFTCLLFVIACNNKTIETQKSGNWKLKGNYKICDTCTTIILVHHDECTECADLYVDSGTIFIPTKVLSMIDTLSLNTKSSIMSQSNQVNLSDINLDDASYFNKLWSDSIKYEDRYLKDLHNAFRLKGRILSFERRFFNGKKSYYPSLYFKVLKAEEIDTAYLRKTINKNN
ncbi:hypothetical protein EZ428_11470 [Pedobacter frigiditerrae]|uniref:Uncharacterized protein n=1 Tax=Pedobacter frigiditerrae TaxID=2530452 RepID=A0A4R0MYE2_9SPHI|nr:hypothetical protein [Pedobacter frigiditerrae]TCC92338.1 hypothetical protein EZ428_11470 [Pedobacter frigiditerrae]